MKRYNFRPSFPADLRIYMLLAKDAQKACENYLAPTQQLQAGSTSAQTGGSRLIGAHMPTSGGLYRSLTLGAEIGCNVVQLFTCSPRQWNHPELKADDVQAFLHARDDTGIDFTVAHDSYLINLAAPSEEILEKSRRAFLMELKRANTLQIKWLVTHMGAHLDQGEDEALARLAQSLRQILEETDKLGYTVGIALETTAGQGTGLGWRFEQLGRILRDVGDHPRLGVCLDTCHVFVAGYDLRSRERYDASIAHFDSTVGIDKLKVLHLNDAKKGLGSRVDRHEHIGFGEIGMEPFGFIVTDPRLMHVPAIVETPDSDTMHEVNVRRLRHMSEGGGPYAEVTVSLFGHYSELSKGEPVTLKLPCCTTLKDALVELGALNDELKNIGDHCRFAVNDEFCELTAQLVDGCAVAVIPPVSGG